MLANGALIRRSTKRHKQLLSEKSHFAEAPLA
jgi:hypothetical protein